MKELERLIENEVAKHFFVAHPQSYSRKNLKSALSNMNMSYSHSDIVGVYNELVNSKHIDKLLFKADPLQSKFLEFKQDAVYINYQYWLQAFYNPDIDIVALRADMGVGKTFSQILALSEIIRDNPDIHVVMITGRALNTQNLSTKELKELEFHFQYDKNGQTSLKKSHFPPSKPVRTIVTINSLPLLLKVSQLLDRKGKLIVILDEFETILTQNFGDANDLDLTTPCLRDLVQRADLQIITDAFLTDNALNLFLSNIASESQAQKLQKNYMDMQRWKNVQINLIESIPSFSSKLSHIFTRVLNAVANDELCGAGIYINIKNNADKLIDVIKKQFNPKSKNADMDGIKSGSHIVSESVKQKMRDNRAVIKFLYYYSESTVSKNTKQTARVISFDFGLDKVSDKALNKTQLANFKSNPNQFVMDNDISIIIHTPVMEAGISFDKLDHYKYFIGWLKPSKKSSGANGALQAFGRLRGAIEWNIFIHTTKDKDNDKDGNPVFRQIENTPSSEKIIETARTDSDEFKEYMNDRMLNKVKHNEWLLTVYAGFKEHDILLHNLYSIKIFHELVAMKGGAVQDIHIYRHYKNPLPVDHDLRSIDAVLKRFSKIKELYTQQQMKEIEANFKLNYGKQCLIEWFDSDTFEATKLISMISTGSNPATMIPVGRDDNDRVIYSDWDKINEADKLVLMQNLYDLKSIDYYRNNAATLTLYPEFQDSFKRMSAMKAVSLINKELVLRIRCNEIERRTKKLQSNTAALQWILNKSGVDTLWQLTNKHLESVTYNRQTLNSEGVSEALKCSEGQVVKILNAAMERLGINVVECEQVWNDVNKNRGQRNYGIEVNPLIHKYNLTANAEKRSELKERSSSADKRYEEMLDFLDSNKFA